MLYTRDSSAILRLLASVRVMAFVRQRVRNSRKAFLDRMGVLGITNSADNAAAGAVCGRTGRVCLLAPNFAPLARSFERES